MAWPSNYVFGVEIRLENIIYVPTQFQDHRAEVKVTAEKNGYAQVCAPLGRSLICLLGFSRLALL